MLEIRCKKCRLRKDKSRSHIVSWWCNHHGTTYRCKVPKHNALRVCRWDLRARILPESLLLPLVWSFECDSFDSYSIAPYGALWGQWWTLWPTGTLPKPFLYIIMHNYHLISDNGVPPMCSHKFKVIEPFVPDSVVMPIVWFVTSLSKPVWVSWWCHQMLVQRLWFALETLPSFNMLSQTLQKTWNFSSRVRVSAPSHCDMTLIICDLDVIIRKQCRGG